jgi:hypothetical protein
MTSTTEIQRELATARAEQQGSATVGKSHRPWVGDRTAGRTRAG